MGFLDNLKGKMQDKLQPRDDYYDDGYGDYDEPYDGDDYYDGRQGAQQPEQRGTGLLGNPSRPDADSVNVYTRSGRHLSGDDLPSTATESYSNADSYASTGTGTYGADGTYGNYSSDSAYRAADDDWRASADAPRDFEPQHVEDSSSYVPAMTQPGVFGATGNTPADKGLTAVPRVTSGKLPAYVLKPTSYDDVQMVVRRVRTNQPVVLSFKNLKIDTAKRILDFCFGLACGIDGGVEELGDRVFVVLPQGVELADSDKRKLRQDGLID